MSRVLAPVLRNGFPFLIRDAEVWDGSTFSTPDPDQYDNGNGYYVFGQPQHSDGVTRICGPGTPNPLGLTFPQLVSLYWRARNLKMATTIGGVFALTGGASSYTFSESCPDTELYSQNQFAAELVVVDDRILPTPIYTRTLTHSGAAFGTEVKLVVSPSNSKSLLFDYRLSGDVTGSLDYIQDGLGFVTVAVTLSFASVLKAGSLYYPQLRIKGNVNQQYYSSTDSNKGFYTLRQKSDRIPALGSPNFTNNPDLWVDIPGTTITATFLGHNVTAYKYEFIAYSQPGDVAGAYPYTDLTTCAVDVEAKDFWPYNGTGGDLYDAATGDRL